MPADVTTAPTHASVAWAGETLRLLPERAVWWRATRTLFVADLHLGKAATYRALGQPVPHGTTQDNLERLCELIDRLQAQRLVCLGDFLHAAAAHTPHVLASLQAWRERHSRLAITLVRGNHDDRAGDPPPTLGIEVVNEPWLLGPFACCHHPQTHPTHHVMAGHLHPVVALQGPGRDRLRLPCFVSEAGLSIRPAFGAFTGGHFMDTAPDRQHYAVGGERVWTLPVH